MREVEAENKVYIEGILSENKLEKSKYTKDGHDVECIRGTIVLKVDVDGESMFIPVNYFENRFKKDGTPNKVYTSLENFMNSCISMASVGGDESRADKLRITGSIDMNEHFNQAGQFCNYVRITAKFINKVTGEFKPHANFNMELYVNTLTRAVDSDGVELDPPVLNIQGILVRYGGKVNVVDLIAKNPNVIDAIESSWKHGDTAPVSGRIHYTRRTIEKDSGTGFGEQRVSTRTEIVNELIVTGGNIAYDDERAFDDSTISKGITMRKADIQKKKDKGNKAPDIRPIAPPKAATFSAEDLGF